MNSLNINPIKIVRLDQLDAVISEIYSRCRIRGQFREEVAQRPPANRRVHLHAGGMRLRYQPRLVLARGASRWLPGDVPRAVLDRPLGGVPIRLAEQHDGIGPAVGAPDVALLVGLEEGEIVPRDLGMIEVGRLGETVAIVPLPCYRKERNRTGSRVKKTDEGIAFQECSRWMSDVNSPRCVVCDYRLAVVVFALGPCIDGGSGEDDEDDCCC